MTIPHHPEYVRRLVPPDVWASVGNVVVERMQTAGSLAQMGLPIYPHYVCGTPEDVATWLVLALHTLDPETRLKFAQALLPDAVITVSS